ncbi:MAG TPA: GntP family transporter [Actinomyces sp.]|nr:GntP family transporter [Acidobacteriota bacterium]HHT40834.1 GntP family transporter [Actinomyces sp.]
MSAGMLLFIAAIAVAVLLFLVIKVKMSAFVGLLLVALGTALATGVPIGEVVPTMVEGMGKTLGNVMIIVGLGAMLGKVIEEAGGAESLATYFTQKLGTTRVIGAVTIAAFILGIPVFFDVGFIILAPIVFGFAKVANINPLKIGLPVGAVMLTVHVAVPPHPGPVAAAEILGVDPGRMIMVALPITAITGLIGFYAAKLIKTDKIKMGPSPATEFLDREVVSGGTGTSVAEKIKAPSALTVTALILLPIIQIMIGTVGTMQTEAESRAHDIFSFVGASAFALLVAVIVAYLVIGHQQKWSLEKRGSVLDSALPAVAVIVFVTGAGGVFANVLVKSGIGDALADALVATHIPIIVMGYVIALALRASQGSATVAILTSAGLLAAPITAAGYTPLQSTLVTVAMCFGGLGLSHINDSGFWIVTKYLGLTVKDGIKSWTVLTTIFSLVGFLLTTGVFLIVS